MDVSVSRSKDSTNMYTLAIKRGRAFQALFADTWYAHPETGDYVRTLPESKKPLIEMVREDFTDSCLASGKHILEGWPKDGMPEDVPARHQVDVQAGEKK